LFLHFHYLECAFPIWLGLRHGIALFLLVRTLVSYGRANTRDFPSAVTASSPQKKTAKSVVAAPSNESKVIQEQQTLDKWYHEMGHLSTPEMA
jgi:hypothetical protein